MQHFNKEIGLLAFIFWLALPGMAQNVGIGTATPAAQLHVRGTVPGQGNVLFTGVPDSDNAGDPPVSGAGTRLFWYLDKAAFRAGLAGVTSWDKPNIGLGSAAFGNNTTASGDYSFATGVGSIASGTRSIAMGGGVNALGFASAAIGYLSSASGFGSAAIGAYTEATGNFSTALGTSTIVNSFAATVVGRYNVGMGSATSWIPTDPIFEIGNGINDENKRNAVSVLKNGNTGIGTHAPAAQLHVHKTDPGQGNVLFTGVTDLNNAANPPMSGPGTRMMWYLDKAAFRAGDVNGTHWDKENIGFASAAMGLGTRASGSYSFATGAATNASGSISTALGNGTLAQGSFSTASGNASAATGAASVAMGNYTVASGDFSTTSGTYTMANSYASTALGRYNANLAGSSNGWILSDPILEIGIGTNANNRMNAITVLKNGNTGMGTPTPTALLHLSTSPWVKTILETPTSNYMGYLGGDNNAVAMAANSFWNGSSWIHPSNTDPGMVMLMHRSNERYEWRVRPSDGTLTTAMVLNINGNMGIGNTSPTERLDVSGGVRIRSIGSGAYVGPVNRTSNGTLTTATSDAHFKKNILPISGALEKTLQLQGVTFLWKDDVAMGTRMGFVAQQVEQVTPELVFTNEADGYKGVNYAEATALLVEAIREQQLQIEALKEQNESYRKRLEIVEEKIVTNGEEKSAE